ncbi:hypothetical protein VTN00DRAFT_6183 [Thermoascus crustaceus]|uniref:uncharacterized protein n=1 Tax=Thermoascus crustaceus TaxID=5088 RepID=UPI0037424092
MHFSASIALLLGSAVAALQSPHQRITQKVQKSTPLLTSEAPHVYRNHSYLNAKTKRFAVNGSALPDVDFNIGESYAGTLPNTPSGNSSLFFWFFPSKNPAASDEITIWLNGGPGCSSLVGLLQENGPFLWQPGTYAPIQNPYSWVNLTNMVWVDQPAGTGFSPGPPTVNDETDVAKQFMDFWKRFVDTFGLQGRKVYITGESYAGQYIPYIASAMLDKEDTKYFNVKGIQINDPSINEDDTLIEAPSVLALNHFKNVFALNETFMTDINKRAEECGYNEFMENALTYPPKGKLPTAPDSSRPGCDVWESIISAAYYVNPCFNIYHLTDFCPYTWNTMGFPSLAGGPNNYFNRSDVQAVIHAPPTNYLVCGEYNVFPKGDKSVPSALGPLPSVIERTNNTIIGHGWLDFLLFANGTLATIQNMTWNGAQGFQKPPKEPLFVPYHAGLAELGEGTAPTPFTQDAGAGYLGTAHTERGLTFTSVYLSGHEIPQYVPGAAYRQLEFLLGRVKSLSTIGNYTTLP